MATKQTTQTKKEAPAKSKIAPQKEAVVIKKSSAQMQAELLEQKELAEQEKDQKSIAERMEEAKKCFKRIKKRVWFGIIGVLMVLFFVFGFTARYIFGRDAWITRVAEEGIADVINIVRIFEGNLPVVFNSITVLFLGIVIISLVNLAISALASGSNRSKTVFGLVGSFVKYIGAIVVAVVLLGIWGVDTVTLVAGLGILGLIIGLGAQSLISDILAGLFIVFENNFQVGDIVTVEGFRGEVCDIGIRTTRVRSPRGDLKIINNSSIRMIVNMSRLPSLAIVDVVIPYEEDLAKVERIIEEALFGFATRLPAITEEPEYLGVFEFSTRGVGLRLKAECKEADRIALERGLNRELKLLFDKNKIKIAVEQLELKK